MSIIFSDINSFKSVRSPVSEVIVSLLHANLFSFLSKADHVLLCLILRKRTINCMEISVGKGIKEQQQHMFNSKNVVHGKLE